MLPRICLILTLLSLGCSVPSEEQPAAKKAPQPAVTAVDQGHLLPSAGRTKVEFVEDNLLEKEFLPGGNIAEYERDGKTFQQFLARLESPEKAGFRLLDFKGDLTDAKYIGHLGGYFGTDGDRPVLVFQRGRFVAGVIGLPQQEADSIARELALRLR